MPSAPYGEESPMPGREKEYYALKAEAARPSGLRPTISEETRGRSPGLQNNFYDTSTADFKRPHGMRPGAVPPSPEAPPTAAAGAPARTAGPDTHRVSTTAAVPDGAPPFPMSMDAYYQVSDEAPMPGREKEYETFKAQAAQAAQESPRAAMEAMDKIVNVCMTRTAAREACEATAPPESDKPWGEKEDRKLAKAGKALEAAKARLVEATQALRDSTTASANSSPRRIPTALPTASARSGGAKR